MQANDYIFVTYWRVKGKADEAYEILTDIPGYLRWWQEVYLAVQPLATRRQGRTWPVLSPVDAR